MRLKVRWVNNTLSPAECAYIITECVPFLEKGTFEKSKNPFSLGNVFPSMVRNSKVVWIYPESNLSSIMQKVIDTLLQQIEECFYIPCKHVENIQFTQYEFLNHYSYHMDSSPEELTSKRLLSASVELTDPNEYWGGQLKIKIGDEVINAPKEQGNLTIFPSCFQHKVTPVLKGTRYSLVIWVHF
tara:strand:+ start:369 stop:923 length:555 start_codon:yes stop_codon:yes gene_type:complete